MGQRERISITRVEFLRYYDGQKVRDVELQARRYLVRKMVSQGVRREDIAEKLGISIRTVYRLA